VRSTGKTILDLWQVKTKKQKQKQPKATTADFPCRLHGLQTIMADFNWHLLAAGTVF